MERILKIMEGWKKGRASQTSPPKTWSRYSLFLELGKSKRTLLVVLLSLQLGSILRMEAQTVTSRIAGNWNGITTWLTTGAGTISTVSASSSVTGLGTSFSAASMVGHGIYTTANAQIGTRTISSVGSATSMTLSGSAGATQANIAWKHGVLPGNFTVNVNTSVVVNANIAIDYPANYTVNATLLDPVGGSNYNLTISGQNASNRGVFTVDGNTTFGGTLQVNNNGHLIIKKGDTLRVGSTNFSNNSFVTIDSGGVLIVTGTLTNEVSSTNIQVNGSIIVIGNVVNQNNGDIYGVGSVTATQGISNGSGSNVFGSGTTCSTGPCSSSGGTTCGYTSSVGTSAMICNGTPIPTLTSTTNATSPTYQWQYFNTTTPNGFKDVSGATSSTYTPPSLTTSTSYRLRVVSGGCTQYTSGVALTYSNTTAPTISISASATTICSTTSVTFTASTTNTSSPTYQWKRNGSNISGATSSTYITTTLADDDVISCAMVNGGTCYGTYNSGNITMTVNPTPTLTITNPTVCAPTTVDLSAASVTAGSTSGLTLSYWTNAGATTALTGYTALKTSGNYYIKGVTAAGCPSTVQPVTVTVNSSPTVSIDKTAPTICSGSSVALVAGGEPGNALTFGANQYIQLNDDPLQSASSFTFEAWIYQTASSDWQRIFDFGNSTTVNMFFTTRASQTGRPRYAITTSGNGGEQQIDGSQNFTLNAWNHVAITYNGATNTGTMYLNGVSIGTNTNMTLGPDNLTPRPLAFSYFGESQYAADPNFQGKLDEIRIWNVARTATEINNNKGLSIATNTTGLVAYYKLNEGNGTSLVSVTGSSTATTQGTPTWGTSTATVAPPGGLTTTYAWSPATNLSATTGTTVTASPTTTTTYTVTGTYSNNCATSATSTVTVLTPSVAISTSTPSICSGSTVSFTATPTNGGTPTYQWKKNGNNISGATSSTQSISGLVHGDIVTCQMTPTGTCTSAVTSNSVTMSVSAVSISTPATTVCAGTSVTFTATATNINAGTYQWRKGGSSIPGATSSTYTTTTLANNDAITCTITPTGACTSPRTSTGITMTVNALPTISAQPSSVAQNICLNGTSTALSVTASGTGISYQWFSNTTASNSGGSSISGATTNSYTPPTNVAGTTYYYVVVSGTCTPAVTSNVSGAITINTSPAISVQPSTATQTVCINTATTALSVTASGAGLTYQWFSNATASNSGGSSISGATSSSYTPQSSVAGALYYYVVVTGSCSPVATSNVSGLVTVNAITGITAQPTVSTTICEGGGTTFSVTAVGSSPLTYQWRRYGSNIANSSIYSGVNTATLTIANATAAIAGDFSVAVTGTCGSNPVLSNNANLVVNVPPTISSHPSFQTICDGGAISYAVVASGGSLTYQWKENGVDVSNGGIYSGVTTATLTLTGASTPQNGKNYSVVVSNGCTPSVTSNTALLTVVPYVTPTVSIVSSATTVCSGTSVSFTASAGNGGASPSYQWRINGNNVGTNVNPYSNSTLSNGDVVSVVMTSNSQCVTSPTATSNNVSMTIQPSITNNTVGNDEAFCYNTVPTALAATATIAGGTGSYAYQWQSSADNTIFANIVSATSAGYAPAALTSNTYYRRTVTSGTCSSTSNTVAKLINGTSFTWVGGTSIDWNTASNWCGNAVPTATDNVTINSGTANSPTIGAFTAHAKDLSINNAATLTLSANALLNVTGNWTNTGTVVSQDKSKVRFSASSGTQTITGTAQTFYNLEKTAAGTLTIGTASDIIIRRGGLLDIAAGTFDANNRSVLLKSKVAADNTDSTASLGVVAGTLVNASNFKVERYNVAVRGFRYIAAPVTGVTAASFKDSIIIAGPVAAGFDAPNTTVSTIKSFVGSRAASLSKCFVSFTTITTPIVPSRGYYLFVPAKRTTVFPANEPVTLLMKGTPITGNVNFDVSYFASGAQGWNLIGNPYASAIDWDHPTAWTKTNIDDAIYIWDPISGVSGGYYSYVSGISSDARDNGSIISSGQGFFVKGSASPALSVTENAKVNSVYGRSNFRVAQPSYVTLKVTNQNGDVDYTTVRLDDESGRMLSATKMYNGKINIYTKNAAGDIAYSIHAIHDAPSFVVPIYIESTTATLFNIEVVKVVGNINSDNTLKIKDAATGTYTDVVVGAKISYVPDGNSQRLSLERMAAPAVITSVGDEAIDGGYELYPTHIHSHHHPVLYTHDHLDKKIEIFKANGERLALHTTHHTHYSFDDFSKYDAGVYMVKVTAGSKTHVFKIVK